MADMHKRHWELLADAIEDTVQRLVNDPAVTRRFLTKLNPDSSDETAFPLDRQAQDLLARILRCCAAGAFAEKLKYTGDSFDPNRWRMQIIGKP
jgi:hypothetical protein